MRETKWSDPISFRAAIKMKEEARKRAYERLNREPMQDLGIDRPPPEVFGYIARKRLEKRRQDRERRDGWFVFFLCAGGLALLWGTVIGVLLWCVP